MTHYDLFAGIGGFSLAIDEVFHDRPIRHVFCEREQFPTAVLKQHWPDGEYWGDIADLVTYTEYAGLERRKQNKATRYTGQRYRKRSDQNKDWTIVTGGFPCQPFSHAGRRRGTADDRYKWPEMFAVIRNVKPEWVIAENVRGLVTWNDGMVLEQVCTNLESEGYEVQPFIIPAVSVGAPHRRDRVWIIAQRAQNATDVANTQYNGSTRTEELGKYSSLQSEVQTRQELPEHELAGTSSVRGTQTERQAVKPAYERPDWEQDWREAAFATCNDAMDDGLPRIVDGVSYSFAKWRKESLRAYGNGIVHQIAVRILKTIKDTQDDKPN